MEKNSNYNIYFRRFTIMVGVVLVVIILYILNMMRTQLQEGEDYRQKAIQRTAMTVTMPAARGEIVDRYGRPIAVNRMGYNVTFNRAEMPKGMENEIIWQLIKLFAKNGETECIIDNCPIIIDPSGAGASFELDREAAVSRMKSTLTLQDYASPQNCLDTMNERYEVGLLAPEIARQIMGVRLNMEQMEFSRNNDYTFAVDISTESIQEILENNQILRGVDVQVVPIREYVNGLVAPHLVGVTGPIYAEDYETLKKEGYKIVDIIGKFGIEKEYEKYLRGTDGKKQILRDSTGAIVYENVTRDAQPGNTIVLTIDSELQLQTQEALGRTIRSIAAAGAVTYARNGDPKRHFGEDAHAGAAIVMNCRTFEVLAAVTYPSFDLNLYYSDYDRGLAYSKDPDAPLYNRAFQGTYAPGSTFKPAVALAGLQEGIITRDTVFNCEPSQVNASAPRNRGAITLKEYNNFELYCLELHHAVSVERAIEVSCNVFFYNTAYRLGITIMNDYCRQMGFGVKTGVGLGEVSGVLAGREDRESREENWFAGDTLTAAIGQNDNKFTPLQLAVYTSTIANGGTRYEARMIKTIKSFDMAQTIVPDTRENPVVLNNLNVDKNIINTVKNGMLGVTSGDGGTATRVFVGFGKRLGGKTGSVDTVKEKFSSNAVFIGFAPFEQPEVVVAIVGEKCSHGSDIAPVARSILDEYFYSTKTKGYVVVGDGQLVG